MLAGDDSDDDTKNNNGEYSLSLEESSLYDQVVRKTLIDNLVIRNAAVSKQLSHPKFRYFHAGVYEDLFFL